MVQRPLHHRKRTKPGDGIMRSITRQDKVRALEKVEIKGRDIHNQLKWNRSFSAVKNSTRLTDYDKIASLTKEILSEIKTREHREYIKTAQWKKRRKKKLEQQDYTCELCGGNANQCHHTHYDYLASDNEKLEHKSLIAVCSECHKRKEGEYESKKHKKTVASTEEEKQEVYTSMQENYLKDLKEMKKEEAKNEMEKSRRRWFNQEIDRVKKSMKQEVS